MSGHLIEARRWFRQAQADKEAAKVLSVAGHYAAACFHCQQAAEKALKAVLYSQGRRVVLGHAVLDLARQCGEHDPEFIQVLDDAGLLDQFYIPTRYPNGLPSPSVPSETYTEIQAVSALSSSGRVIGKAETFLRDYIDELD